MKRFRDTGTYQQTTVIGPMQEAIIGIIPGESQRFSERVGGIVYGADAALTLVVDTPQGRVSRVMRDGCR
ncbi:MAG: hypothetical protein U5L04_09835 [Trueperaceae bacterium]|nr:hypothetical protein [Trueperaceae bacterium]